MKRLLVFALLLGGTLAAWAETPVRELRLMTYNVKGCTGMDNRIDYDRTAGVIAAQQPDVCALQELDSLTRRSGKRFVIDSLSRRTGMYGTFAQAIPYEGGGYGVGLLSKEKPLSVRRIALPGREEARVLLVAEFADYYFLVTHLSLTPEDRMRSVEMIDSVARTCPGKPVFLAGDMNFRPDSDPAKALFKTFQPLNDITQPTSPAPRPRSCIDYILRYKGEACFSRTLHREVLNEPMASDHRPVVAHIEYGQIFRTQPYLQNPTGDGITVMWQTHAPAYSWVEYGTDSTRLTRARTLVDGQALAGNQLNKIRLDGLTPGQPYYYRVCSQEVLFYGGYEKIFGGTQTSPLYRFTLPKASTSDFDLLIFNDLHQKWPTMDSLWEVVRDRKYDFVVFNGDCIDDPATQAQAIGSISYFNDRVGASGVPVFYLRGNHEIRNAYSVYLRELFDYVDNRVYSAFNWGDTRFVLLDCGEDKPDDHPVYYGWNDFTGLRQAQVGFLKQEIASQAFKKASKRILIHHIPIYGPETDRYNPCFDLWQPVLAKAPFDVAINGHTHRYAYLPAHSVKNNFPVVIGGGFQLKGATVMMLSKRGDKATLKVWNARGAELLSLDL